VQFGPFAGVIKRSRFSGVAKDLPLNRHRAVSQTATTTSLVEKIRSLIRPYTRYEMNER
jgi:hypothetical protein